MNDDDPDFDNEDGSDSYVLDPQDKHAATMTVLKTDNLFEIYDAPER